MNSSEPIAPTIELMRVTKSFGAVDVLKGINFTAYAGQVTALVGDNGAGKSTLIKGMAGSQPYDGGETRFEGRKVDLFSPANASELGIEVVYQDLALCDNLDITQNMFLGREMVDGAFLDDLTMQSRAAATLDSLGVSTVKSVKQLVASLSGGQRQTVAIARSVLWKNKLVVLDEPTAALGVAQTRQVLALVRELAATGVAVVLVSHNMQEVLSVADVVHVMYLGEMSAVLDAKKTDIEEVVGHITGIGAKAAVREGL
ncbi:sugar ABC transporter ATP-binding protein [Nakamurella antarctica]|uniref:Sugar ABC transporter ATP-binding protein n=1 Tax=Nakamurella antarctica TaxID=1902245 RepID=A0A3G8ZPW8_9ACTN|nr:ATP-binding cassette domain-containing protein [Nakamurella antarctica]AZI58845.1 sugar ABC transporter ATP-binding protein [Nakamurella antarctica]